MSKTSLIWRAKNKELISCNEKIKILNENFDELQLLIQSVIDDAVIIGCDEKDIKQKISNLLESIHFSYKK